MNYEAVNFYKTRKSFGGMTASRRKGADLKLGESASPADLASLTGDGVGAKDLQLLTDDDSIVTLLETVKPHNYNQNIHTDIRF